VAPTGRERDYLVRLCGAPAERVAVIPCGVNLERFPLQDRARCRAVLGLPQGDRVLLSVGRFAPVKGLDLLLDALARVPNRGSLRLLVAGGDGPDGEGARRLGARAAQLGVGEQVRFLGRLPQEELPSHYGAADALVLPSHYESFGLVPLEALSCGTPVIATRVGAMGDVIRPGVNGFLAEEPAPEALARALAAGLGRAEVGGWAPATIRASVAGYTWRRVAEALVAEYEAFIDRPAAALAGAPAPEVDP